MIPLTVLGRRTGICRRDAIVVPVNERLAARAVRLTKTRDGIIGHLIEMPSAIECARDENNNNPHQ